MNRSILMWLSAESVVAAKLVAPLVGNRVALLAMTVDDQGRVSHLVQPGMDLKRIDTLPRGLSMVDGKPTIHLSQLHDTVTYVVAGGFMQPRSRFPWPPRTMVMGALGDEQQQLEAKLELGSVGPNVQLAFALKRWQDRWLFGRLPKLIGLQYDPINYHGFKPGEEFQDSLGSVRYGVWSPSAGIGGR